MRGKKNAPSHQGSKTANPSFAEVVLRGDGLMEGQSYGSSPIQGAFSLDFEGDWETWRSTAYFTCPKKAVSCSLPQSIATTLVSEADHFQTAVTESHYEVAAVVVRALMCLLHVRCLPSRAIQGHGIQTWLESVGRNHRVYWYLPPCVALCHPNHR